MHSAFSASQKRERSPHQTATRVVVLYLVIGLVWIWATDIALWCIGTIPSTSAMISGTKGTLLLFFFAWPLFRLVRSHLIEDHRQTRLIKALVNATPDPIFVQNSEGIFVFANEAASRCLGVPSDQIVGRTSLEACGPEISAQLEAFRKSSATEPHSHAIEIGGPDGHTYLVSVAPLVSDDGKGAGSVMVCHDVTTHHQTLKALAASEERYRAFADHAADAFFLQSDGGRILDANARACDSLGYSRDELIGATHLLFSAKRDPHQMAPLASAVLHGEQVEFEDIHRRKDGGTFPVEVRMRRVRVGEDWIVLSTARDITNRKASEAARHLADSHAAVAAEQRSVILNALPIHVALIDGIGIITAVNDAWYRFAMSNAMAEEAFGVGVNYLEVCDQATGECSVEAASVAAGIRAVLAGKTQEYRLKYPCHSPQERRWFELVATSVPSGGAVLMHINVTDRHQADEVRVQQAEGFRLLSEVASRLLADRSWPELVGSVLDRAAEYLECDVALSFRFNGTDLELTQSQGLDETFRRKLARLPLGAELCGYCAEIQQPLYYPHLQSCDEPLAANVRSIGLRCYVAFPLVADGRLLGTVSFASRTRDEFEDNQREFARTVAQYLATASERLRVKSELVSSEERYRACIDHAADLLFLQGPDGTILDINRQTCEALGYSRDELIGVQPTVFDRAKSLSKVAQDSAKLPVGKTFSFESHYLKKDGTQLPVEVRLRQFEIGGRRLIVGLARDVTERERADMALRESEERFRAVVDQAADAIFLIDRQAVVDVNRQACESLGYSRDELIGMSPTEFDPTVDLHRMAKLVDEIATGHLSTFETLHRRKDGTTFPVEVRTRPVSIGGALLGLSIVRDISDRKKVEESQARLAAIVEMSEDAIISMSLDGTVLTWNAGAERLFGYANAEAVGNTIFQIIPPELQIEENRLIERLARGETINQFETVRLAKGGRRVDVSLTVSPLRDARGKVVAASKITRDTTARNRADRLTQSLLASVSDAILTIDTQGIVWLANPATEKMFGYSQDELIGKNVSKLMPRAHREQHDRYISDYLRTGIAKIIGIGREVVGRRKDGIEFPLELSITELRLGEEHHFTGVIRDVTARRKLEDQFRQSQKMEAVGRLAGGVAHDFNNLLTVINGYSVMLMDTLPVGEFAREALAEVLDAGERAARLTQQLLAFSRKSVVEPRLVDLNDVVHESAKLLRRLIGEDISMVVLTDPAPVRVVIDPGQLEQVLMNLAVNARDAMPTGGRLTLETRLAELKTGGDQLHPDLSRGKYASLRVADTGSGMTDEVREKIFEPFFTTKGIGKGTGLGLAVVHGVVKQAGGSVAVESTVGVGTTFGVLLPLAVAPSAGPKSEVVQVAPRGTETILVVEDETALRMLVRVTLERQGYSVLDAADGKNALEILRANHASIGMLVTDVIMPGMSGRELAEAARVAKPGLKVLYMSGYTDDALSHYGLEEMAKRFIQKPFTPMGLARRVRTMLDQPE